MREDSLMANLNKEEIQILISEIACGLLVYFEKICDWYIFSNICYAIFILYFYCYNSNKYVNIINIANTVNINMCCVE